MTPTESAVAAVAIVGSVLLIVGSFSCPHKSVTDSCAGDCTGSTLGLTGLFVLVSAWLVVWPVCGLIEHTRISLDWV